MSAAVFRAVLVAAVGILAVAPAASAQTPALPVKLFSATSVDFSATPNPQFAGQSITFDGSGSHVTCGGFFAGCVAETYNWDFGDGTTGSGAIVNHAYARAGTYTVTLRACDCDGGGFESSRAHTVTILAR
jgi:chitodextrinase